MLFDRDRKTLHILSIISTVLCLIVCIPFGVAKVPAAEVVIKYLVIAIAICVFTAIGFSMKYRNYRPSVKFTTTITYYPLFSYVCAVIFNSLSMLIRSSSVFFENKTSAIVVLFAFALVALVFFAHAYCKKVVAFTKNEAMLCDGIICVVAICLVVACSVIASKYSDAGALETKSALFIIVPAVLGVATGLLHVFTLNYAKNDDAEYEPKSREELIALWKAAAEEKEENYNEAREEIIEAMYDYSCDQLGLEAQEVQEGGITNADADLVVESLEALLATIESHREDIKSALEEEKEESEAKIAELQARIQEHDDRIAAEEQAAKAAEEAKAAAEARKAEEEARRQEILAAITPKFTEFVDFIKNQYNGNEDVKAEYTNEKQNVFKATCRGKQLVQAQLGNTDFRFSILCSAEDMRSLLFEYNGVISFEKKVTFKVSNYELNQLKVVYKGDESITAEKVQELISGALANLEKAEEIEADAKAEAKDINKLINRYKKEKEAEAAAEAEAAEAESAEEQPAE